MNKAKELAILNNFTPDWSKIKAIQIHKEKDPNFVTMLKKSYDERN